MEPGATQPLCSHIYPLPQILCEKEANIYPSITFVKNHMSAHPLSIAATSFHLPLMPLGFVWPHHSLPREVSLLESSPCFHHWSVKEWVSPYQTGRKSKRNRPSPSCHSRPQGTCCLVFGREVNSDMGEREFTDLAGASCGRGGIPLVGATQSHSEGAFRWFMEKLLKCLLLMYLF